MDKDSLEFLLAFNFTIANTYFEKWEGHLIMYKIEVACSPINLLLLFFLMKLDRKLCILQSHS